MKGIVIHSRFTGEHTREHFFSTDHCQGVRGGEYPKGFVPTTHYLPSRVVPRPSLPSGIIETLADLLAIYYADSVRVNNPDPRFAVFESDEDYRNRIAACMPESAWYSFEDLVDSSGEVLDAIGRHYQCQRNQQ